MYLACCKGEVSEAFRLQAHKISMEPYIWSVGTQKHKLRIFMINLVWYTMEVDNVLKHNCWGLLNHLFKTLINWCSFNLNYLFVRHSFLAIVSASVSKLTAGTSLWQLSISSKCKQLVSSFNYSWLFAWHHVWLCLSSLSRVQYAILLYNANFIQYGNFFMHIRSI